MIARAQRVWGWWCEKGELNWRWGYWDSPGYLRSEYNLKFDETSYPTQFYRGKIWFRVRLNFRGGQLIPFGDEFVVLLGDHVAWNGGICGV